eukprot:1160483-Pelagomonas_calceolata.AAC.5
MTAGGYGRLCRSAEWLLRKSRNTKAEGPKFMRHWWHVLRRLFECTTFLMHIAQQIKMSSRPKLMRAGAAGRKAKHNQLL